MSEAELQDKMDIPSEVTKTLYRFKNNAIPLRQALREIHHEYDQLIKDKIKEARIDELKRVMPDFHKEDSDFLIDQKALQTVIKIKNRINQLTKGGSNEL